MPQFLVAPEDLSEGAFLLRGEEAHHLRVLRVRAGETIRLFDGSGRRWVARLDRADGERASGAVLTEIPEPHLPRELHLHLALLEPSRFEDALEKTTELGVTSLQPIRTARTNARRGELPDKRARWEKIALAACKQSLRPRPPLLLPPADFAEALAACPGKALIAWEDESARGAGEAARLIPGRELHVFIGPEGGFTPEEIEAARRAGAPTFSLGANVLRAETAAVAAAALLLIPSLAEAVRAR